MKNLIFGLVLTIITWTLIEVLSIAAHFLKFGDYDTEALRHQKVASKALKHNAGVYQPPTLQAADTRMRSILHPYVGYVVEGRRPLTDCEYTDESQCFSRLRTHTDEPMPRRKPGVLNIAILGGSFADGVARLGAESLTLELKKHADFSTREMHVYALAAGGYKQPQQATNLSYFISLGAEFDLIINIDGFNEVATPYTAYRDRGLHPAFPSNWDHRVSKTVSTDYISLVAAKQSITQRQSALAALMLNSPQQYSPTLNFVWRLFDSRYMANSSELTNQMATIQELPENRDLAYEALGPDYNFRNWEEFHADTADIWMRGSQTVKALADSIGAEYFHFIQPNQYIEGSKPLSDYERASNVLPRGSFGNVYQVAYPLLPPRGEQLRKLGIRFEDLTYVFSDIQQTLYIDNCCHINAEGNEIIGKRIGEKIVLALSK